MDKKPDYKMYDKIIPEFNKLMRYELEANHTKGDRSGRKGWLRVKSNKYWVSELYYHVGKLQAAMKEDNFDLIKEHCADIANIAMMTVDVKVNLLKK